MKKQDKKKNISFYLTQTFVVVNDSDGSARARKKFQENYQIKRKVIKKFIP